MKDIERQQNLTIAIEAARRGQEEFENTKKNSRQVVSTSGREVKVNADFSIEKVILDELQNQSNFPVLSEESSHIWEDRLWWIVDPLDGSANWLRDIPCFSISVGLFRGVNPILGVVLDLERDDLFHGIVGLGAWLNDSPISVSEVSHRSEAILCTGFPASYEFGAHRDNSLESIYSEYFKIRMFGSAAMSLAYVARGATDVYWEEKVKLWDIAAGVALVRAAGGDVLLSEVSDDFSLQVEAAGCQELFTKGRISTT